MGAPLASGTWCAYDWGGWSLHTFTRSFNPLAPPDVENCPGRSPTIQAVTSAHT